MQSRLILTTNGRFQPPTKTHEQKNTTAQLGDYQIKTKAGDKNNADLACTGINGRFPTLTGERVSKPH